MGCYGVQRRELEKKFNYGVERIAAEIYQQKT
jgi:hypothetical protein